MAAVIGSNSIPPEDAHRLISAHNGNVALLYIWQSMNSRFDAEAAARDLCMTTGEITAAKEKLDRLFASASLSDVTAANKPAPEAEKPPQYNAQDVKTILASGGDFKPVVEETARILGHPLSTPDIATLLKIYDWLGMPAEVMMELVNYCSELSRERFGASRRLPVREIYNEASRWAAEGILSLDAAEKYIHEQKHLRTRTAEIAAVMKLDASRITVTPLRNIESWIAMGFDNEAVAEAYDRTFTNTGGLSWKYMDAILRKWHAAGLHTIKAILEKDSPKAHIKQPAKSTGMNKDDISDFLNDSNSRG